MDKSLILRDLSVLKFAIRNENYAQINSLQEKYSDVLLPCENWEPHFRRRDSFASLLAPEDIPSDHLVPTIVTGDGNCLFNAASINLVGNEALSVTLRLLTAAEVFIHADFYASHPRYVDYFNLLIGSLKLQYLETAN